MFAMQNVSSWVDAFKPRRSSTSSSSSSGSRSSSFSMFSWSGVKSRSGSMASLSSTGTEEEQEHLMAEQPKRAAYVPQHAARSFMKTATSREIRKNAEIL